MEVSIKAEPLFELFGFPITNSILLGTIGFILVVVWLLFVASRAKKDIRGGDKAAEHTQAKNRAEKKLDKAEETEAIIHRNGFFTRLALWCFEGLYKTVQESVPNKKVARQVAPFSITIFFIVGIQYYTGILPFAGDALTLGGIPLLRSQASDLNFTFALAIITIVAVQVWAFRVLGFKGNMKRYFVNPFKDPIGCFAGFLELIGEFSRMIALSMRLFGNVFAGEVLLIVVTFLTSFASPILLPFFYIFELFIGGIQAYVFFMLATVFVGLAVTHSHPESNHSDEAKQLSEVNV